MRPIVLLITMSCIANAAALEEAITVHLFNGASVPGDVIAKGEQETSRIFRFARIAVRWINCASIDAPRGRSQACAELADSHTFTIAVGYSFLQAKIKETALGFATPYSGEGNHAGISYSWLAQVANDTELIDRGSLLGATMAHELAHLLLIRHGPGIMQANWTRAEFFRIRQGLFFFTSEQSTALRAALRSRYPAPDAPQGSAVKRSLVARKH